MSHEKSTALRYAVVGGGVIFPQHRKAVEETGGQLVALCDVNEKVGRALAEECGCAFFTDVKTMLHEVPCDVVVICVPHPFHAALAEDAMRGGAHVLVEKPIAVTAEEADAMIETARATNRVLAVNYQARLAPVAQQAKAVLESGKLGTITRANLVALWMRSSAYYASAGWRGTWRGEGGGVLMNQAPHDLDLLCHLMGRPARVFGCARTQLHSIAVEDTAMALLEWENGALGTLFASTAQAGESRLLEIWGSGGHLKLTGTTLEVAYYENDFHRDLESAPMFGFRPNPLPQELNLPQGQGDHTAVYRNLAATLRGEETLSCDGASARDSLELANAITLSSHAGRPIELPLDRAEYSHLLETLRRAEGEKNAA